MAFESLNDVQQVSAGKVFALTMLPSCLFLRSLYTEEYRVIKV